MRVKMRSMNTLDVSLKKKKKISVCVCAYPYVIWSPCLRRHVEPTHKICLEVEFCTD